MKLFNRFAVFIPILLISFISLSIASWDVSSLQDSNKQCGEIFFQGGLPGNYKGISLPIRNQEQISDFSDIWFHLRKETASESHNETIGQQRDDNEMETMADEPAPQQESVSLRIQKGCNLKLSPNSYLRGDFQEFSGDVEAINWFVPDSASCECPKVCKCEDNQLRRTECARAYLKNECTNCNAMFANMRANEGWKSFPPNWSPNVKSIILNDGCSLSLKHAHSGHRTQRLSSRSSRINHDVQQMGNITQYSCECSTTSSRRQQNRPTQHNPNYPQMIDIPKSKGAINTLLFNKELKNHPGLISALQSLRNKRSSKNAYMLLLGLTGSGKSSAVNLIFDHPNITKVGEFNSTTSDILQFSIPVPVPELGMSNSALHVIDTPGIADTRGLTEDARFLASLDEFLNKNEDLRRNVPNVVLIFSKFNDNRYRGEGAPFVKMLRTIDLFKDRIIDKKATNVIFVLTHYMSETKEITRDPGERIRSIRQVIQEFSTLPRPIHIVLAENKPEESYLPSINGFYQLPNGEFYPKNLFDQMQRNLHGDPVGEAIIRTAFSNSDSFQVSGKVHRLLHRSNSKVTRYLGTLASFNIPVSGTEVSTELDKSYELLDSSTKASYPDALLTLQRSVFMRNIIQISDLPQSVTDTLKLFENIHINPVTLFLLENAFNITIPDFKGNYIVGSGYSLVSDTYLSSKIFQTGNVVAHSSDLLFKVSDAYHVELQNQLDNQLQVSTNMADFIKSRLKSLGLGENVMPYEAYQSSPSDHPGFNLISLSENEDNSEISWNSLTAIIDYHTFHIGLSTDAKYTDEFSSLLGQLEKLNLADPVNVQNWQNFFNLYGTHVVNHAFGGGSIKIKVEIVDGAVQDNTEKLTILSEAMANIMQELADELIGKDAIYSPPPGINYEFSQKGGDRKFYWSNFSDLDDMKNIDKWKDSLKYEPVVLTTRLQLIPISEVVKELNEGNEDIAFIIEEAAATLMNASLVYIPVHRVENDRPTSRDRLDDAGGHAAGDYESMQEFANIFLQISEQNKGMQEELVRMMAQSQEKQQLQEEKWKQELLVLQQQKIEEERRRKEDERYDDQMKLAREKMEMERMAKENELRAQMELARHQAETQQRVMMEEIRAKNQQSIMAFLNAENDRRAQIAINQKSSLDKALSTVGNVFSGITQMLPTALMGMFG